MKLAIGDNIKSLRKSKNITQENLAEMLGVSCQSVSRWELGTCYPDMELLPELARIFNISVDQLLGVDELVEKKKVDEYLARFQTAISKGLIDDCIAIAREGVAEFPNNYSLLNKLMYALFLSGDETGNIPNWKENMEKNDKEIVALGERISKYCPDQDIRLEATGRLAFHHCEMGRRSIGRAIYETLPRRWLCRENQMWWCLEKNEKLPFLYKNIYEIYYDLEAQLWTLATDDLLPPKDALQVLQKKYELTNLIYGDTPPVFSWGAARFQLDMALLYAKLGDFEHIWNHLQAAADAARQFDTRPSEYTFTTLLLGTVTKKRDDFDTADDRPLCEILRDKWLAEPAFDPIRNDPRFQNIIHQLTLSIPD
ncbi:MAG: helix-turn-helix transcriptional regulator [Firmicutes bacterium]|nr:helix-turn-helix transcriptional regulator [Bacillota bacterium]